MGSLRVISEFVMPSRRCAAASRIFRARSTATAGLASETGMGAFPISFRYVHSIEYMFRILNRHLQLFRGSGDQWTGRAEQMFNILNSMAKLRNYSPLVCKFLGNVTKLFHDRRLATGCRSYLLEQLGLRNDGLEAIGLPIALSIEPALIHFAKGRG